MLLYLACLHTACLTGRSGRCECTHMFCSCSLWFVGLFDIITSQPADITVSPGTMLHILPAPATYMYSVKSATNLWVTFRMLVFGIARMAWMPVVHGGGVQGCSERLLRCLFIYAVCARVCPLILCHGYTSQFGSIARII